MTTFTMDQESYEALVALARKGATTQNDRLSLDAFLQKVEKSNGIKRYQLWIQWQETDQPLPPTTKFPDEWPPNMRYFVELLSRPIARVDVDAVLRAHARKPVNVLVTPDPAGALGWSKLDDYFLQ